MISYSVGEWEYDESTGQVDVPDGTICTGITWRPNGHLIEAAPELLSALIHAIRRTHGHHPSSCSRCNDAEKAIARAAGL